MLQKTGVIYSTIETVLFRFMKSSVFTYLHSTSIPNVDTESLTDLLIELGNSVEGDMQQVWNLISCVLHFHLRGMTVLLWLYYDLLNQYQHGRHHPNRDCWNLYDRDRENIRAPMALLISMWSSSVGQCVAMSRPTINIIFHVLRPSSNQTKPQHRGE